MRGWCAVGSPHLNTDHRNGNSAAILPRIAALAFSAGGAGRQDRSSHTRLASDLRQWPVTANLTAIPQQARTAPAIAYQPHDFA
jgi:hypothetical protein